MSLLQARARHISSTSQSHNLHTAERETNQPIQFPLLSLPFEIRHVVLRALLHSPTPISFCYIRLHGRLKLPTTSCIYPAILQTSKQMHNEGHPILYDSNVFSLTHTLALTSLTYPQERMHIRKRAFECGVPTFWKGIRQLQLTIRTTTRNGRPGQRSMLSNVHRLVEYVLDDGAPLRSLKIEILPDENPFGPETPLSPEQLWRILKPLTLLRVDGVVSVDVGDCGIEKRIKKAIVDGERPGVNIYQLRDGICEMSRGRMGGESGRNELRCVLECEVEEVRRVYDEMIRDKGVKGGMQDEGGSGEGRADGLT